VTFDSDPVQRNWFADFQRRTVSDVTRRGVPLRSWRHIHVRYRSRSIWRRLHHCNSHVLYNRLGVESYRDVMRTYVNVIFSAVCFGFSLHAAQFIFANNTLIIHNQQLDPTNNNKQQPVIIIVSTLTKKVTSIEFSKRWTRNTTKLYSDDIL